MPFLKTEPSNRVPLGHFKFMAIQCFAKRGEYNFIVRENEPIKLLESPRAVSVYTAISRKVVGKMCTRQSRKVIWDMINTLFLTTVPVEPTFVAFL